MAVTTDLQTINLSTGAWVELTGAGAGRITDNDPDNFIAGTNSTTSQTRTGGDVSIACPANTVSIAANSAVFVWIYHGAMPTVGTFAQNGLQVVIGNSIANYNRYTVSGSDTLPKGGWINVAVDPTNTPTNVVGSPSTVTSTFGSRIFMTGSVSKGNPYAVDYIRHGRSAIVTGGNAGAPENFTNVANTNDLVANKWGLFENIAGGFSQKGRFQIGSAATATYFEDSNKSIVIEDSLHVSVGFNEFSIQNASSTVIWTGIGITALGTVSRGNLTIVDNATVTLTSCTFTDMGTFVFNGGANANTLTSNVFRRCNTVTQGGAIISNCLFDSPNGAVALISTPATLSSVINNQFNSNGTGHAVNLGTTTDATTVVWDNIDSGYAAISGSTGNETILINYNGVSVKDISVAAGASTPTVMNTGTGTVTVTAGLLTVRITVTDTSNVPIQDARVEVRATQTVGTITTGDVLLTGLTNASGIIEDVGFVYEAAFNPIGLGIQIKARQGSVSPYKVPSTTVGTIVDISGFSTVVALQPDE